jgi:hypothetical protein
MGFPCTERLLSDHSAPASVPDLQEAVFRLKPLDSKRVVPKNRLRYAIFHLLHHRYFMYASYTIICLNCVTLTLEHWGASRGFSTFMWGANVAFTVAIGIEVVSQDRAGCRNYPYGLVACQGPAW